MNTFEWEERIEKESYTLDQYLKKSPPVLSQELKQKYTKSLEEYKKALKEAEMIMQVSLFGNSSLKSLAENIKRVIYKIEDYLYLYKNWKPTPPAAPAPAKSPVAPPATKPIVPAPVAPPATKPIVPAPVTPPTTNNEEEPKTGFFTPTNILLVLLVVGGGFFLLTRKGK